MPRSNAVELTALRVNVVEASRDNEKENSKKTFLLTDILEVCN
jgi:hypothetical protein